MKENSYTYVNGKFQPVNVIPSGEIKCSTCLKYYPSETIQSHLSTHIKPQFLAPKTHENKVQKVLAPKFLEILTTEDSDLDIKSLQPNEIPVTQHERKFIAPPSGYQTEESQKIQTVFVPNIKTEVDRKDLTSNLRIYGGHNNPEEFQILDLQDKYEIPVKSAIISKKNIFLYKNEKSSAQLIDEVSSPQKHHLAQNSEPIQYTIREDGKAITQSTLTEKSGKKITCNFKRLPATNSTIFNTKSLLKPSYISDDISEISEVKTYKVKYNPQTPVKTIGNNQVCDNKCPCCGGFYCSYCKSNIPPKYRPVHQVSPQQEQQIREFYRAISKESCKNCDK